jgi:phenylpyruvate tautomerase PptA (4-oxalocrotonate tautomerase family)
MPLVRVSVSEPTQSSQRKAIADAVYEAMRQTIGKGEAQYVLNPPSWVHAGVAN